MYLISKRHFLIQLKGTASERKKIKTVDFPLFIISDYIEEHWSQAGWIQNQLTRLHHVCL